EHQDKHNLFFKIVQSGETIEIPLTKNNLLRVFNEIYIKLLKELRLKPQDTYLSNEDGKMIGDLDLNLSLKEILKKFGNRLKLYYEKII
ncbi:MAG: hypothetical protein JSV62_13380, partial [Promethearchaeota archaeon]